MCPANLGISPSPYTGWQTEFYMRLKFRGFWAAFFIYKFFYKFFYNSCHNARWWKACS
jgi:hypothetical protein